MRSQHKRPDVDEILASFIRPSAGLRAEPEPETTPSALLPAAESSPAAPEPTPSTAVVADDQETKQDEATPELRLHTEEPSPPRPSRRSRARKPKPSRALITPDKPLVSDIPQRAFFKYYNLCQDRILNQIPSKAGKVLLNRFFRLTYGFNRNWCRVSMGTLAKHIGAEQTNHVRSLLKGELGEWIYLIAKGDRQGPSLWVLDLGNEAPHPWDLEGAKTVSEAETFEEKVVVDNL